MLLLQPLVMCVFKPYFFLCLLRFLLSTSWSPHFSLSRASSKTSNLYLILMLTSYFFIHLYLDEVRVLHFKLRHFDYQHKLILSAEA